LHVGKSHANFVPNLSPSVGYIKTNKKSPIGVGLIKKKLNNLLNYLMMNKDKKNLDTTNPNRLLFNYEKLNFEILGGINSENYQSLRITLITGFGRIKHRDSVDLLNHEQISNYMKKVAETTQKHPAQVKLAFDELVNELLEYKLELQNNYGKTIPKTYQLLDTDIEEAIEVLKQPNLLSVINSMIGDTGVIGNETNRMILFLTHLTRKTNSSLHSVIQSQYNYLQNKLALIIPEEEKFIISHISDNSVFYFDYIELHQKAVFIEDTISNRKNLLPLIGLQHNNLVTKTTVVKNEYAQLVTSQKHVKGNVSLCISTKDEQAFSKNGALSFIINEETGSTQDEKVLMYQRKQSAGLIQAYNEQKTIQQLQNIQRVLSTMTVINPFAMEIQIPEQIKNKQITNLHYLRFIEIITFLKQYQRSQKANKETGEIYIETTLEDIKEANQLLTEIFISKSDDLNKPIRLYLEQLKSLLELRKLSAKSFTLHEASMALKVPKTSLGRYNKVLIENGFIESTGEGNKKDGYRYRLIDLEEYNALKMNINTVMENNVINIEKHICHITNSEPKTTVNQNESGAFNPLKNKQINEVNHNSVVGLDVEIKNTINPKKKVA
jgi:predicted transcriptional regulator